MVGLPLGLCVLVSASVVLVAGGPLLQTVQGLEERRDNLLSLQHSRSALERQLNQAQIELQIAEEKQALLLGLLAGRDKVQTFLALLNQQALASGVRLQRYEPLKTTSPQLAPQQRKSRRSNNRSKANEKSQQPQDPLQALGYHKSSFSLEVSGPFIGLQTFLQMMEALELLVESSELELQAVVEERGVDSSLLAVARTQLNLKLSFYDLAPAATPPVNGSKSSRS